MVSQAFSCLPRPLPAGASAELQAAEDRRRHLEEQVGLKGALKSHRYSLDGDEKHQRGLDEAKLAEAEQALADHDAIWDPVRKQAFADERAQILASGGQVCRSCKTAVPIENPVCVVCGLHLADPRSREDRRIAQDLMRQRFDLEDAIQHLQMRITMAEKQLATLHERHAKRLSADELASKLGAEQAIIEQAQAPLAAAISALAEFEQQNQTQLQKTAWSPRSGETSPDTSER